jgi:hypothetical protein
VQAFSNNIRPLVRSPVALSAASSLVCPWPHQPPNACIQVFALGARRIKSLTFE